MLKTTRKSGDLEEKYPETWLDVLYKTYSFNRVSV